MSLPNAELALALLVDATAESARTVGQAGRELRENQAAQELQRAADARSREIRNAFGTAGGRVFLLAPVWLFLCFIILANNYMENYFADGSYAVTTWTFLVAIGATLAIDLLVAPGSDGWFIVGAVAGFALSVWYTVSRSGLTGLPIDVSMFWLTGFFGAIAYLISALRRKQRNTHRGL